MGGGLGQVALVAIILVVLLAGLARADEARAVADDAENDPRSSQEINVSDLASNGTTGLPETDGRHNVNANIDHIDQKSLYIPTHIRSLLMLDSEEASSDGIVLNTKISDDDDDSSGDTDLELLLTKYNVTKATIVGGTSVESNLYPWMSSLQVKLEGDYAHICGGSLIDRNWVLTAAHCFNEYKLKRVVLNNPSLLSVRKSTVRKIKKIIIHPEYDDSTQENDIALLKLNKKVPRSVDVVTLSTTNHTVEESNEMATALGWGSLWEGGWRVDTLRKVEIPIVSRKTCTHKGSYKKSEIFSSNLCAGYKKGGKDTCGGDSGGPLIVTTDSAGPVLVGITSWGDGCGVKNKYGIYTKVSSFTSWIEQETGLDFD